MLRNYKCKDNLLQLIMISLFYLTANINTMLLEISGVVINAFVNNTVIHFNTPMK